jgi:hypothetical protein
MKKSQNIPQAASSAQPHDDEPIGIVISSGERREPEPRFAAYVWGPVPCTEIADDAVAVA